MKEARDLNELMIHDVQPVSDEYQRACTPTQAVSEQGERRERDHRLSLKRETTGYEPFDLGRASPNGGACLARTVPTTRPQSGSKSSFSIALIFTIRRRTPARAITNQEIEKCVLIPL